MGVRASVWRVAAAASVLAAAVLAQEFENPVRLVAEGKPIDVDHGHAAPYVYDYDGDGVRDLLVGQFGEGRLRVYLNRGTDRKPVYGAPQWFMAGGAIATVPSG